MTSSDQPLSNSPKCETCGDSEFNERGILRPQHSRIYADNPGVHPFKPAPLSNSEGDSSEAFDAWLAGRDCWVDGDVGALAIFEAGAQWAASRLSAIAAVQPLEGGEK